ncbi:MAG TPA: hypothetical protein VGO00_26015 [Kofleriaceae bacterium]|jgi:3-hydroxymyristoyl/3-hydroxydecanoyl-(acyl carrier protein) dehydratase|nr:hypothetical protein [Kofleriaceae bacterium]
MALDPDFVADCPYGPGGLLLDDIVRVDREASLVVATMPTSADLPLTRDQRAHPERHPRHVAGGLMIHATGMLGFAHAYFVLELRHAEGWTGYGTQIHEARFRRMARIGPPMSLACTATSVRRIRGSIVARYQFRFEQDGEVVYTGDQTALFSRVAAS